MFCTKCGAQLEDGAKFCTHCGNKVVQSSGFTTSDFGDIMKSVDLQKVKNKASSVILGLKSLDEKKNLYGIVITMILVILFGSITANVLHPAKKVEGKVTYASEPFSDSSGSLGRDWYQRISVVYKNKECTGIYTIGIYNPFENNGPFDTIDTSLHVGDKVSVYVANGKLMLDKNDVEVSAIKVGFSAILLLASLSSCVWFSLQYFKGKRIR